MVLETHMNLCGTELVFGEKKLPLKLENGQRIGFFVFNEKFDH